MTVKELIARLIECPMDAKVEIEVLTDFNADYSCTDKLDVIEKSEKFVAIIEQ